MHVILSVVITALFGLVPYLAFAEGDDEGPLGAHAEMLQVGIVGDVMAHGLAQAITRQLEKSDKPNIELNNFAKGSSGFVRDDYYDWNEALPPILAAHKLDYILVFMGSNDRQSIRLKGKSYKKKTPIWREEYIHRINQFLDSIKLAGVQVIWLGQPISRGKSFANDMALYNEIYRQQVESHEGVFFDVWDLFAYEDGKYTDTGPDVSGQMRILRAQNGIHFTRRGYDKLAFQVLNLIAAAESGEDDGLKAVDQGELVEAERYDLDASENSDIIIVERLEEAAQGQNSFISVGNKIFGPESERSVVIDVGKAQAALPKGTEMTPLWKKVLEDGEVIDPEFGRSDDFSWPRN
ncbi:MAG: DUF459 domain-containing protein [Alphaproteobacteria bacterium]|nr:DUF459 domain-containing protein [Alphaproteobacteria bacterium]